MLPAGLHCPVTIDNDVHLAVLVESAAVPLRTPAPTPESGARADAGSDWPVFVQWGRRIGTGISGRPDRGTAAAAGELGFIDLEGR